MKTKCVCILALLGIFFTQNTSALPLTDEASVEDYIKTLQTILTNIQLQILSFFEWIDQRFTDIFTQSVSKLKNVEEKFEHRINSLHNVTTQWLEIANNLGVKVDNCTKNAKKDMQKVVDEFVQNQRDCMKTVAQEGIGKRREMETKFDEDAENLNMAVNKLSACLELSTDKEKIKCIEDDIRDIFQKESNLNDRAEIIAEEFNKWADQIVPRLETCAITHEVSSQQQIEQIGSAIVQCIKDKIDEPLSRFTVPVFKNF